MDQAAEAVAATDLDRRPLLGQQRFCQRRTLLERAVRAVFVVMADVGAHDLLQLASADDQDSIETFAPQAAHPALGVRLRLGCSHRCPDDANALGAEHLVEVARELIVAVADENTHGPLAVGECHHQVACLLGNPAPSGIRGHAAEVHASTRVLDEEEHVQAPQPERIDGQEVTGDDRGRLRTQELRPTQLRPPRRGSIPFRRRIVQIVLGASAMPSPTNSPWMRR
jgi:hypothetical protein